jgi:AcrR family transcriptional regulator
VSRHEARRNEILVAALAVLAREGIAETTTRKIAAEANVNQAMLRYYFGSKDELLFAVLRELMRRTQDIVRQAAQGHTSWRDVIANGLRAFWEHVEREPELQIMQYELTLYALRHTDSAWLAQQQYSGYSRVVEEALRDYIAPDTCSLSFSELARFIIGGLDGLILQFISDRDPARARRDLEHLITAVIALAESR